MIFCTATLAHATENPAENVYKVELRDPLTHSLHVSMRMERHPADPELQLPVWNATYQVRDFAQYVSQVRARVNGKQVPVLKIEKSRWKVSAAADEPLDFDYDTVADLPGPFGMSYDAHHAFFNFAELLVYEVSTRRAPVKVEVDAPVKVAEAWRAACALPVIGGVEGGANNQVAKFFMRAENYDRLVDSPIELGTFIESGFTVGEQTFRVAVDAEPGDYDMKGLIAQLKSMVTAEMDWMDDRPFSSYLFIYHFPRGPGGGGMEHAYSTAIDITVKRLHDKPESLLDVSSHEFFHLWNVKRIRPRSLEPVDYTREQYTRALWFSEGVTSTAGNYARLRAGLLKPEAYLEHLAAAIAQAEREPARRWQSPEESSLDAWLEKYPFYNGPSRSVSYYVSGEILGTMLDLEIRKRTGGRRSLRDLFQWMNREYAKQGRFFEDSEGVQRAAEAVTGSNFGHFFENYVKSAAALPYDEFLSAAGYRLVEVAATNVQGHVDTGGFRIESVANPTAQQLNIRRAWLSGDADSAGAKAAANRSVTTNALAGTAR